MEEKNKIEDIPGEGVAEIRSFTDKAGRQVKQFVPIDGGIDVFKGCATVQTKQGPQPFEFGYPEDYDIKQCFVEFDVIAQEQLDIFSKEQLKNQSNIVVPR